eukprot:gene6561-8870_t
MRRDEHGEAIGRETVNLVPEFAASLRIDARGGLVEEEELRRVEQAGGESEALFPAAGELAGELVAAVGEAEALKALLHGGAAIGHGVEARDEIEIFADAQVLVVTELLRHVADVAFDLGLLRADIVAEAGAGAGVGRQEAAEHADEAFGDAGDVDGVGGPAHGKARLFRERDIDGLAGMKVARGRGVGEDGLNEEHEFGAVLAVVEDGWRVFGFRREVTHAGVERGAAGERDAHGVAGFQRGEIGLRDVEADLEVFGREEGDDGCAGGDELALAVERVVDERGAWRRLGFLRDAPIGALLRGGGAAGVGRR